MAHKDLASLLWLSPSSHTPDTMSYFLSLEHHKRFPPHFQLALFSPSNVSVLGLQWLDPWHCNLHSSPSGRDFVASHPKGISLQPVIPITSPCFVLFCFVVFGVLLLSLIILFVYMCMFPPWGQGLCPVSGALLNSHFMWTTTYLISRETYESGRRISR